MPSWDIHEKYARLMGIPIEIAREIDKLVDDPRWHDFFDTVLKKDKIASGERITYHFYSCAFYNTPTWEEVRRAIERYGDEGWRAFFLHIWLDLIERNIRGRGFALLEIRDIHGYFRKYIEEVGDFIQERWDEIKRDVEDYVTARRTRRPVKSRGKTPPSAPFTPLAYIPPYIPVLPQAPFIPVPMPPVVFDWGTVSPEDRGLYLTLGVGQFIELCGSTYKLVHGLEPAVARIVADVVRDAGRKLLGRATTLLEWQAGYWMDRGAEHIAYKGAYDYIIENTLVLLQAEDWFKNNMKNSLSKYKFTIIDEKGKPHEYTGGRIWIKTVLYKIYDALGAKPPRDVEAAYKLFLEWKKRGYPLEVTVPLSYTGGKLP